MIYVGLSATTFSIFLVVFWVYRLINTRRHIGRYRWQDFHRELTSKSAPVQISHGSESKAIFVSRKKTGLLSSTRFYKNLERRLAQGDIYLHPGEFVLIVFFWGLILGGILFFISGSPFMLIFGLIIIIPLASMYVSSCKQKKIRNFNNQIVDMLALISNGLKAGHSFFQSIGIVAREMQPPMSQEFARMMNQINMGLTVEEALNELVKRVESPDLELVVTAILIHRQVGGNLSEVLDNISYTIRERIMLKNQVKVLTSQGRLSGIIISLLAPALAFIIFLMNPDFILVMIREPLGIIMIIFALLFQIIGVFFIRKIVDIDI